MSLDNEYDKAKSRFTGRPPADSSGAELRNVY